MQHDRILVIAPHALDEVLGCGGVMARYARGGAQVQTMVLTGGDSERHSRLKQAARTVAERLGCLPPLFCDLPENGTDSLPLGELVARIEREVAALAPRRVYVSHGGNLNIDHQRAFQAAVTACRPLPGSPVRELLAYEVLSSSDWAPPVAYAAFQPQLFVDIEGSLDAKLEAVAHYGGEMRSAPHARSPEAVAALARLRGGTVGLAAAEAFMLLRAVA